MGPATALAGERLMLVGVREDGPSPPGFQGAGVSEPAFTVHSDELQGEVCSLPDSFTHPKLALHSCDTLLLHYGVCTVSKLIIRARRKLSG